MPLPRRHSSFLGQSSSERPAAASGGRTSAAGATMPRGTPVGPGATSGLGTRISRRALGISSVFLQGMRSCTAPVLPRAGDRTAGGGTTGLNSCLIEYRDKVRALEELNRQLEQQIRLSLDRKAASAGAWGPLRREWEDIYRQVSEAILENARLMLQTENVQANAEDFRERLEPDEASLRTVVEDEVGSLRRVMEEAAVTKVELEERMESMRAELLHLESRHEQDVRALYSRTAGWDVDEPDTPVETGLDRILAHIRTHWEQLTERNRADTDGYLESKVSRLSAEEQQAEALKAECSDVSCRIQSLQAETESIRALKRGLENSLSDARHWHDVELQNLGSVVARLEAELSDVRSEIEQQRRDFDMLLSNRQRLEQQIGLYHGILDGEEDRFLPSNAQS
uniref:Beaded filament structural protein 2, phakinin n=1 Tax=Xiphophorus maculatus TaxID=8083 RepID=M4A7W7_XIPMA